MQRNDVPPRSGAIINVAIRDKGGLYSAYMPFIKNGGLFIPTHKHYSLGDEIFLVLTLLDDLEKLPVAGKVIWITPAGAQGNRKPGIGVQFRDNGVVRTKIETHLAAVIKSDRQTETM